MKWYDKSNKTLQQERGILRMKDEKKDVSEEFGGKLSPAERAIRVLQQIRMADGTISGNLVDSFDISDWEVGFLRSNENSTWPNFTSKQEVAMQKIEKKVFGDPDPQKKAEDETGVKNDDLPF